LTEEHFELLTNDWESSDRFDDREKAVIRWASALTRNAAREDDAAFAALKEHFSEKEIVELTLFTCLFNAWNRLQDGFHNPVEAPGDRVQWQPWK
jgi:alkylhydroperoxidase family enzyme